MAAASATGFSATSSAMGSKAQSPTMSLPMIGAQHQQQQQAIPSSAAAAAAAAVAAAAQLAAAAQMVSSNSSSSPQISSPHQQQPPPPPPPPLAPLPNWAYGHPALLPVDPQTESLAENWRQFQQAAFNYNLDPHILAMYSGGPGGPGGMAFGQHPLHHHPHNHHHHHRGDLSARRKNATRETTSILKAWLNEHKKNPYPTKGEKIMLAIITTMTLTQVSTWFANARRRLKKENKMTWVPRNRPDEDEDNDDDDDDVGPTSQSGGSAAAAAGNRPRPIGEGVDDDIDDNNNDDDSDDDDEALIDVGADGERRGDADNDVDEFDAEEQMRRLRDYRQTEPRQDLAPSAIHSQAFNQRKRPMPQMNESAAAAADDPAKSKPRIWSIMDTLNKTETRATQPQLPLLPPPPPPPPPPPLLPPSMLQMSPHSMPHHHLHHHLPLNGHAISQHIGPHQQQQLPFGLFSQQHPKLPMMPGGSHPCLPPPPPPPPHHQLMLPPPLYYSLFNAFNRTSAASTSAMAAAAAAAAAAVASTSYDTKLSPEPLEQQQQQQQPGK